jgi:hypothetical protein
MKPSLFAVSLAALGVLTPVSGCSISGDSSSGPNVNSVTPHPYDAGAADAAITQGTSSSGGGGSDAATWGNPLCRMTQSYGDGGLYGCNPDQPATPIDCAMDGGAAAGDGGGYACRVQPMPPSSGMNSPTTPATGCSPSSGDALAGTACLTSDECAPGFDCVGAIGDGGHAIGVCRHYCCAGNSACEAPDGGQAKSFCDVQFLTQASATPVPVCMPIVTCNLQEQLAPNGHPCLDPAQTCAVVREDGQTGCVDVGPVGPGQSCDADHCNAGLVCLGAPGQRVCLKLCDTQNGAQCTAPETCQGGLPLFQDPRVGVCRQ